jgi:hypothetical protein
MQAQGSSARLAIALENTFKTRPALSIHDCEAAWAEQVNANATVTADTAIFRAGTKSFKAIIADAMAAGTIVASAAITSANLSTFTHLGFWVYSSVALTAGDFQILLDDTASCASPSELLNVPAISAAQVNTWQYMKVALANPATDLAIISVGLKMINDKGAMTIYLDQIEAIRQSHSVPFITESLRASKNLFTSNILRTGRQPLTPVPGAISVGGDVSTELSPIQQLMLFYGLFGSKTISAGPPYTHTFTFGTTLPSFMIEKQFTDLSQYLRYEGCVINGFNMDVKVDGPVTCGFNIMGCSETPATAPHDDSPYYGGWSQFNGAEVSITQGGVSLGIADGVALSINNNHDGSVYVLDGTGCRKYLPAGKIGIDGKITALFESMALYNLAVANTETSLVISCSRGAGTGAAGAEKMVFTIDELIFKQDAPVINGPTGVKVELTFQPFYDNGANASAVKLEVYNAVNTF